MQAWCPLEPIEHNLREADLTDSTPHVRGEVIETQRCHLPTARKSEFDLQCSAPSTAVSLWQDMALQQDLLLSCGTFLLLCFSSCISMRTHTTDQNHILLWPSSPSVGGALILRTRNRRQHVGVL